MSHQNLQKIAKLWFYHRSKNQDETVLSDQSLLELYHFFSNSVLAIIQFNSNFYADSTFGQSLLVAACAWPWLEGTTFWQTVYT
jgi:hypothetical protein